MASVNKVILVGNLGRDPEVRYSPEGTAMCNISIATTNTWKDRNTGEKREDTEWHRVVFYNRLAEIVGEYLRKGRSIYVEGRIKTRKFQDKETGTDRYVTEVVAEQMQMLGGSGNQGANSDYGQGYPNTGAPRTQTPPTPATPAAPASQPAPSAPMQGAPANSGGGARAILEDDDIPFAPAFSGRASYCI
tara:strand:+ start:67104 stop:67673 length:570 start_codon:yes stop_codon:yes gene_type:complete